MIDRKNAQRDRRGPGLNPLREHASNNYIAHAEANVVGSDATVIFTRGPLTGGSLATAKFCRKHTKPHLHLDLAHMTQKQAVRKVLAWLRNETGGDYEEFKATVPDPCVLNVVGCRESKAEGVQELLGQVVLAAG